MSDLPNWVLDLVADLLDEEDIHPGDGYHMLRYDGQYLKWPWCPAKPLARVPDEVKTVARVIQRYRPRPPEDDEPSVQHCTCELVDASAPGEIRYVRGRPNGCVVHGAVGSHEAAVEQARAEP